MPDLTTALSAFLQAVLTGTGVLPNDMASAARMAAPTGLSAVDNAGGSIANGTYYLAVTALDSDGGETEPSAEASVTVNNAPDNQGDLTSQWAYVPGAKGYRIYVGTATGDYDGYIEVQAEKTLDSGSYKVFYTFTTVAGLSGGTPPTHATANAYKDKLYSASAWIGSDTLEIIGALKYRKSVAKATLSGARNLNKTSAQCQFLDPDGAAKSCVLPEDPEDGLWFTVWNIGTVAANITVDPFGAEVGTNWTLANGQYVTVVFDGSTWRVVAIG